MSRSPPILSTTFSISAPRMRPHRRPPLTASTLLTEFSTVPRSRANARIGQPWNGSILLRRKPSDQPRLILGWQSTARLGPGRAAVKMLSTRQVFPAARPGVETVELLEAESLAVAAWAAIVMPSQDRPRPVRQVANTLCASACKPSTSSTSTLGFRWEFLPRPISTALHLSSEARTVLAQRPAASTCGLPSRSERLVPSTVVTWFQFFLTKDAH